MNIAVPVHSADRKIELAGGPSSRDEKTAQGPDARSDAEPVDGKPKESAATSGEQKRAYPAPASTPTLDGAKGVR
ncbi:hypothetical protein H8A95_01055, partial [Bradyrhizobium sp. Pear76]|uniref:hypothetical protein n=1 Tax=Bradyrhizobium oropedii TaxID=1571201 RepID=UPI001E4B173F